MQLFDTHFHLDLFENFSTIVEEIERERIFTIAVTTVPSVFEKSSSITKNSHFIRTALGLHPELAHERAKELTIFSSLVGKTRFIGEIGLDFTTNNTEIRSIQESVFTGILDICATFRDKVLTIHSRRAHSRVVELLGVGYPGTPILHWFTGSQSAAKRAVAAGCYFSVNPAMTSSASGKELILSLPIDRLLLESDGPFLSLSGRPAHPRDTMHAIQGLSKIFGLEPGAMGDHLISNFRRVIGNSF